jgi:hypothetical protein
VQAQFAGTEAEMDEIIANGSAAAASCPGFTQEEALDMEDDDLEEEEGGDEPMEVEPEPEPPARGRKKKRKAVSGEPRVRWMAKEDECLAEAWKTVSMEPITGSN